MGRNQYRGRVKIEEEGINNSGEKRSRKTVVFRSIYAPASLKHLICLRGRTPSLTLW